MKNENQLSTEAAAKILQGHIRKHQRIQNERDRIKLRSNILLEWLQANQVAKNPFLEQHVWRHVDMSKKAIEFKQFVGNGPNGFPGFYNRQSEIYQPQKCSSQLAQRILKLVKQVKLFEEIHHITSHKYLESAIECLYGRQTLEDNNIEFLPRVLDKCDVLQGDGNVICFGAFDIDSKGRDLEEVMLSMNLEKMRDCPNAFFKQIDFGFVNGKKRTIKLSETQQIQINYAQSHKELEVHFPAEPAFDLAYCYFEDNFYAAIPCFELIFYNVKDIHQILTMTFFKYLDNVVAIKELESEKAVQYVNNIYSTLEKMDDTALVGFLTEAGKKISDTMEFNFYGAYQIDLEALTNVTLINPTGYDSRPLRLCIEDLIACIEEDEVDNLEMCMEAIPNLFGSQRFREFLLRQLGDYKTAQAYKRLEGASSESEVSNPETSDDDSAGLLLGLKYSSHLFGGCSKRAKLEVEPAASSSAVVQSSSDEESYSFN